MSIKKADNSIGTTTTLLQNLCDLLPSKDMVGGGSQEDRSSSSGPCFGFPGLSPVRHRTNVQMDLSLQFLAQPFLSYWFPPLPKPHQWKSWDKAPYGKERESFLARKTTQGSALRPSLQDPKASDIFQGQRDVPIGVTVISLSTSTFWMSYVVAICIKALSIEEDHCCCCSLGCEYMCICVSMLPFVYTSPKFDEFCCREGNQSNY